MQMEGARQVDVSHAEASKIEEILGAHETTLEGQAATFEVRK